MDSDAYKALQPVAATLAAALIGNAGGPMTPNQAAKVFSDVLYALGAGAGSRQKAWADSGEGNKSVVAERPA